jgi:hypothetical protein
MDNRIQALNFAQLQDMQGVLTKAVAEAKSGPWREANQKLLDRVNVHIVPRREEAALNEAKKEAIKRKARVKRINAEAKLREKELVMNQIKLKAAAAAQEDVREAEFKRQVAEKNIMMEAIPMAEDKRWKYVRYGCAWLVLVIVIVAVVLTDPLLVACGVIFAFLSTGFVFYRAYKVGIVEQRVVTEEELEHQRMVRTEELIQKALNSIKQKEIEFNNKRADEAEERRQYRISKKMESARVVPAGQEDIETAAAGPETASAEASAGGTIGAGSGRGAFVDLEANARLDVAEPKRAGPPGAAVPKDGEAWRLKDIP